MVPGLPLGRAGGKINYQAIGSGGGVEQFTARTVDFGASDARVDVPRHEVTVTGEPVPVPPKEFELLQAFLRRKGRLLTRDFLIEEVWGPDYFGDTKMLDVHVKHLRRKIEEDPHRPAHLLTVRGLGYKFVD